MKRYETFLDKHCGQPFANIEEDANGGLVMYDEAQAEIDRLKAENAELLAALESIVAKNAIYHRLNDNHKWTLSKHQHDGIQEAIDLIAKINGNQEIAKARGES